MCLTFAVSDISYWFRLLNFSKQQMCILDQTKTVAECALQLVYAAKEAGGNPKATHAHPDVDDAADTMKETLHVRITNICYYRFR